jgi:hypothetical protein
MDPRIVSLFLLVLSPLSQSYTDSMNRKLICVVVLAVLAPALVAQQQPAQKSMGSVATTDAQVTGGLEVNGQRAHLISNASVTAYDHGAQIDLDRGGDVQVCATSAFHLLRSGSGDALLFALDRGAMQIRTMSSPQDAILTPDLRFTMLTPGPLDLRMRVTREGDTCVENRGDTAPVLQITESFGDATYHLAAGQHVLFEHGSVREVVDREQSNCGCPPSTPTMTVAATSNATSVATPQQTAALNPFPTAQSADLAPSSAMVPIAPPPGNATPAALAYSAAPATPAPPAPAQTAPAQQHPAAVAVASAAPPTAPSDTHSFAHKIGRFFHRLFHPNSPAPTSATGG